MSDRIPDNLRSLHGGEERLRGKAEQLVTADARLALQLTVVERAMDLADLFRQVPITDEDMKVVQVLGMRMFNAFGAALKLALSGYGQNSALIMRDILETVFLLDLFRGDPPAITRWRHADKKTRVQEFSPVQVRIALDERDGFTERKRFAMYQLFSELAGHPNMKSVLMLRPHKDGEALIGPFLEKTALEAVLSEMGKLAIQAGEHLDAFFPTDWGKAEAARAAFADGKARWIAEFYGSVPPKGSGTGKVGSNF